MLHLLWKADSKLLADHIRDVSKQLLDERSRVHVEISEASSKLEEFAVGGIATAAAGLLCAFVGTGLASIATDLASLAK